jgi:signal transduction histidine kinase
MLLSDQPDFFGPEQVKLLTAAATPIAHALENARLYEAEQNARQVADRLRAANLALSERLDLAPLLETLLEQLHTLAAYDGAAVLLLEGEELVVQANRVRQPADGGRQAVGRRFDSRQTPHLRALRSTQRSLLLSDTAVCPEWLDYNQADVVRSWLGVPLLIGGQFIGAFTLGKQEAGFFHDSHLRLIEAIAGQAAIAIHNALLYDRAYVGQKQLRGLTQQVVTAQEDERRLLSYELHDEAGQALSALKINLSLIRDELTDPEVRRRLDEALQLTGDTIEHIRSLAQNLRPPALDVVGLNLTLHNLCRSFAAHTPFTIIYEGEDLPPLPGVFNITFYRFLQEALNNVVQHAQAREVRVQLRCDGQGIRLKVVDDGRGFNPGAGANQNGMAGSLGLFAMKERFALMGGHLQVDSQPGEGVCLTAYAPWQERI